MPWAVTNENFLDGTFFNDHLLQKSTGLIDISTYRPLIIFSMVIVSLVTLIVVYKGIDSAKNYVYVLVLLPYFLLTVLFIKGITLPGFWVGWKYLFMPDLSKLFTFEIWINASTQAIFSAGLLSMSITLISTHNPENKSTLSTSIIIPCVNFMTSIFAALTLF